MCIKKWLDTGKSGNLCPMCRNYVAKVSFISCKKRGAVVILLNIL